MAVTKPGGLTVPGWLGRVRQGAPVFLLILVGGAMADQLDRRRVIVFFQSIQMLCPTIIMALILAGRIEPWAVISLSLVVGVTDALSTPSFQSIVPSIVGRDQIAAGLRLGVRTMRNGASKHASQLGDVRAERRPDRSQQVNSFTVFYQGDTRKAPLAIKMPFHCSQVPSASHLYFRT